MRYLVVYGTLGWQIIDSCKCCESVDRGTKEEMLAKAEKLNAAYHKFTTDGGTIEFK